LDPERGVQIRQRLVEEEYFRLADDGAAHRDALTLAAGERLRQTLQKRLPPKRPR
jgi:hypothetical protein